MSINWSKVALWLSGSFCCGAVNHTFAGVQCRAWRNGRRTPASSRTSPTCAARAGTRADAGAGRDGEGGSEEAGGEDAAGSGAAAEDGVGAEVVW